MAFTITPPMRCSPASSCAAISSITRGWFSGFLPLLAWLVDHHHRHQGPRRQSSGGIDAGRIVVGCLAAAQDHVAILVAGRADGRYALFGHRQEMVRVQAACNASTAMRTLPSVPFLKPTGTGQARRQLAVHLALGGARADRAPCHQVGDVLRGDHVEELATGRQAEPVDLAQQAARGAQAVVDAVAAVQPGR
jgi:hypothetical protein